MNNDFIQNAVNNLYQANELMALKADNARLQAEVERLEKGIQPEGSNDAVGRAVNVLLEKEKEIARLKAEVRRLEAFCTRTIIPNELLQAEVERLGKAGDALLKDNLNHFTDSNHIADWNAAKEGKQS
jgi:hypothetical protein